MTTLSEKYSILQKHTRQLGSLAIAFSGGVDSSLMAKVAFDTLGQKSLAVTADSPSVPRGEILACERIAKSIGINHTFIKTREMQDPRYLENPPNRCYFCKMELYSRLGEVAQQHGIQYIVSGTNLDDLGDYRPGLKAADDCKVVSPLKDAKITKSEIRILAKELGLEVWDKPASPCLSSRIPYGMNVTSEKLAMVEKTEVFLREFGVPELRVRHFGKKARIEVAPQYFSIIEENWKMIEKYFQEVGFQEIALEKFKSGALNQLLNQ